VSQTATKNHVHGIPFWKVISRDGLMAVTFFCFIFGALIEIFAILGIFFSRAHFGSEFNPAVFSAFQEERSSESVNRALGLSDAIAAREASRVPINDEITETLVRADRELLESRKEENQSGLLKAEAEKKAQFLTKQAQAYWEKGSYEFAFSALHQALQLAPDFLEATKRLAAYYEEKNNLTQARFHWEKAAAIAGPSGAEADSIRERIARINEKIGEKAESTAGTRSLLGDLKISRIVKTDLPLDDTYDFRFSLQIVLKTTDTEPRHDIAHTKIEVTFYDQSHTAEGVLIPMKAMPSPAVLRPKQGWNSQSEQVLSLVYSVPHGYLQSRSQVYGKSYAFCGYIVRVFYHGVLQDSEAYPSPILSRYIFSTPHSN
jgi:tetratricopeptide (TPR) repeat protein